MILSDPAIWSYSEFLGPDVMFATGETLGPKKLKFTNGSGESIRLFRRCQLVDWWIIYGIHL